MTAMFRLSDAFTIPGWLSLSRVGFAAWFPFLADAPGWALALVAAAGLTDFLDGWYARRHHLNSATGAVLDPITDKLFATSVMVSLVMWDKLSILEAGLLSVRELAELPLLVWLAFERRARAVRSQHLGSNLLGKLTTALQFGALLSALLAPGQLTWWTPATAITGAAAALVYWMKFRSAMQGAGTGTGSARTLGSERSVG